MGFGADALHGGSPEHIPSAWPAPRVHNVTIDGSRPANALVELLQDDEIGDDPLLEDFRLLRRRLFKLRGTQRSIDAAPNTPPLPCSALLDVLNLVCPPCQRSRIGSIK